MSCMTTTTYTMVHRMIRHERRRKQTIKEIICLKMQMLKMKQYTWDSRTGLEIDTKVLPSTLSTGGGEGYQQW